MKKMLIYIFFLLLISSCTPKIFNGLESSGKKWIEKSDLFPFVVDTTLMYNMKIQYKNSELSGVLLIKPVDNDFVRTLLISTFGVTIFDFEFNETEFIVNRCFEPLEKKKILNLYKKDFRALFSFHLPQNTKANVYEKGKSPVGYKIKTKDGKAYFLIHEEKLKKIEMPKIITSLYVEYKDYNNNIPENILISHPGLKLNMQIERIEQ